MTDAHVYLHTPVTIFAAQINMASVTYPVTTLTFDTVTTGAYTDIQVDMTLLLGTSAGGDDLGRVRVQNPATSTTITIPRTSQGLEDGELTVEDDAYITVWDDYRVWSKIPYIDADGNQKKDTNISVGDYTGTDIPPVANCGPGFADYIDGDDIITVEFDASTSFAMADGETIATYAWDIKDGTVLTGDIDEVTLVASFPAGFRWVALTVVDTNGIPHTARCPVLAVDAEADVTLPHVEPELSITKEGQRLTLRVTQDIPQATYPDGTLVIFWDGSSGDPDDRSAIQFIGWEQSNNAEGRATRTGLLRGTQLTCVDVAGRLASLPGFPQSLERAATVDNWDKMIDPNMDKYIHYLLLWHSTALSLADYFPSGTGSDYPFVIFASEGESLYDQVENEAKGLIPTHHFTCNRRGQLQVVPDPMLQPIVDRTATSQGNFTEATIASIRFAYTRPPRTHWLRGYALLTATGYTDVDGVDTLLTVNCIAPGDAPGQGLGEVTTSEGLARSQSALNTAKGHEYARLNSRYGPISVIPTVDEDFDAVDPADLEWVALTITSATDAQRGLTFDDVRCQVKEIRRRWDNTRTGTVRHGEFTLEVETSGPPAVTVTPVGTPDTAFVPPDIDDDVVYGGDITGYIYWDGDNVCRTWDLQASPPTWENITGALEGTLYDLQYFQPSADTVGAWGLTIDEGIWLTMDIMAATPLWANVLPQATIVANDAAPASGTVEPKCMAHTWITPGHLCVATGPTTNGSMYLHSYYWVTFDYGATWTQVDVDTPTYISSGDTRSFSFAGMNGMAAFRSAPTIYCVRNTERTGTSTGQTKVFISTDGGLTWIHDWGWDTGDDGWSAGQNEGSILHPYPSATDWSYISRGGNASSTLKLWRSADEWNSATEITPPATHEGGAGHGNILFRVNKDPFVADHLLAILRVGSSTTHNIYESTDAGDNWTLLDGVDAAYATPGGWPPDSDQWVLIHNADPIANKVMLTLDNFGSYLDKTGNLESVVLGADFDPFNAADGFALPHVGVLA